MIKKYPSHWVITELENAGKVTTGNPTPQEKQYFINGITPFVRVADLGQLGDSVYIKNTKDKLNKKINNKLKLYPKGSVLFTKSGMSLLLNQRAILGSNMYVVSHIGIVIPNQDISSEWIYYWFKTIDFKKYAHATTLPSLKISLIRKMNFPLPSLNEQNRIVKKIEELFSDLDKATEDLKKTQEQIKIYRQAVLKAAFEGKLTNHEKHINKNIKRFGKYIKIVSGNTPKGINNIKVVGEIPFFKISDMNTFGNEIYMKKANIMLAGKNINEMKIRIYPKGTVIFPKRGGAILTNKKRILFQDSSFDLNTMGVIPNDKIISKYLYYWFLKLNLGTIYDGSSVPQINNKNIVHLKIPIPELEIQNKIIQEIESRLSVCDKVEKTVEQNLSKIKYLRQSILKKAFEGKLVSQDPNDLPAGELLKQIKNKKDKMSKNGK